MPYYVYPKLASTCNVGYVKWDHKPFTVNCCSTEIDGTHTVIGCLSNCAPVTTSQWPAKLFAASKVGCIHHICRFIGGAVLATETLKNSRCKSFKLSQEGHRSPFDGGSRLLTDLLIAPSTCLPHHA